MYPAPTEGSYGRPNNGYGQPLTDAFSRMNIGGHHFRSPFHHNQNQGTPQFPPLVHEPSKVVCGPLLRYIEIDYRRRTWHGSCLVVSNDQRPPMLQLKVQETGSKTIQTIQAQGELLDVFRQEYFFWRFSINIPLTDEGQIASYTLSCLPESQSYNFHLPAYDESMRFMFHSCNGFSDIAQQIKDTFGEKEAPLWQDVLDRHEVMPFHVLLGGGDQLYQDRLIHEDFMKPWVEEKDPVKRVGMTLPDSMREGFEHFYFWNYVKNFGFEGNPVVAKAFASIPSVNMWDDHDIIDGYGSYPAEMQRADCFTVLFANASRFYYLFQHHTTIELAPQHGMIRGSLPTCNHIVTTLGAGIGLISLDARGERTKYAVCTQQSYDAVFSALRQTIPKTIKHLLVLTGVPLIYPRLSLFEKAMDGAAGFNLATIAGKTGALGDIISGQLNRWNGEPELLDDMNDHWTATNHEVERKTFIEKFQQYSKDLSIRVSFLGGDVHCCGAGRLYSKDMKEKEEGDPYLMVQIISSAIVNIPPPQPLLAILNQTTYETFNPNVEEKMYNLFKFSPNGNSRNNKKLMGMRNYTAGYYDENTGKMNFWIQAEKVVGKKGTMGYLVDVPRLVFGANAENLHRFDTRHLLSLPHELYSSLASVASRVTGLGDNNPPQHYGAADSVGGFVMPPRHD